MMCKALITISSKNGKMDVPCGQCMACRINKGRKWTARLLLEQQRHKSSLFVTLSYKESERSAFEELQKSDLQKYFKTLRNHGIEFRYFAVGEYGTSEDGENLPHYHVAMFGPNMHQVFGTHDIWKADRGYATHSDKYWKKGRVHIGELNNKSASYICGYTTKKYTLDHEAIIDGRNPEFTLQSRRPPLGTEAIEVLCRQVLQCSQYYDDPEMEAVKLFEFGRIRINQTVWPLDTQMLRTVYRTLCPSGDGPGQKKTRAELRRTIGEWTGANERKRQKANAVVDKVERRASAGIGSRHF